MTGTKVDEFGRNKVKNRKVANWAYAAEDAYTHLTERRRDYPKANMLGVIDDLCLRGEVTQELMIEEHGLADLIATSLGHVTTAVHGPGKVPQDGGWYKSLSNPTRYIVDPDFREAWLKKRRLVKAETGTSGVLGSTSTGLS